MIELNITDTRELRGALDAIERTAKDLRILEGASDCHRDWCTLIEREARAAGAKIARLEGDYWSQIEREAREAKKEAADAS